MEEAQELKTHGRKEETADLVQGNQIAISLRYLFIPIVLVGIVVMSVYSGFSLVPQHDVMEDPKYW